MLKRHILISLILASSICLLGQSGGSLKIRKPASTSVTRAVIIGISDYEDDIIPDLRFAHKDAEALAYFLQSPAGGNLSNDNIRVYLNEEATGGNVHKALYWLVKESKKDDQCIIYFSGHGDVETIFEDEPGHFLVYDSPSNIYQINSLRIDDLKRIVATLSNQKETRVTVITDACRSGKLAGSEVNGAQATAAALSNQFANEVKIMSCQANEYSIEGEQWGEGRGIFSYHLIEGLTGLADNDGNQEVSLKEIHRYLEDRFDDDLVDTKQTPVTVGDRVAVMSNVDEITLQELKMSKADPSDLLASADPITDDTQLKTAASDTPESKFYEAIAAKAFLPFDVKDGAELQSAEHYFEQMMADPSLAQKIPIIKGDYIAALQDDAQKAINKYLSLDQKEMDKRFTGANDYGVYADYLEKAANLLEESHFFYPQIKAKEIYFRSVGKRVTLEKEQGTIEAYKALISELELALTYQARSPFINNELGIIYNLAREYNKAIEQFDKVIEISPTWSLAYANKSVALRMLGKHDEAINLAQQSIKINPLYFPAYTALAGVYVAQKNYPKAIETLHSSSEIDSSSCFILNDIGYYYYLNNQNIIALEYLNKSIKCNDQFVRPYLTKSSVYRMEKKYSQAVAELTTALETLGDNDLIYSEIGILYKLNSQNELAIKHFDKALSINPKSRATIYLGTLYLKQKDGKKARLNFEKFINNVSKEDEWVYFDNACANALLDDLAGFKQNMESAIALGFNDIKEMEESTLLSSIRSSQEYQDVLKLLK